MEFERLPDEHILIVRLIGELDAQTVLMLEEKLIYETENTENKLIVFDCERLEYISHDIIRIMLMTQKTLLSDGRRSILRGACGNVLETLNVTGLIRLLNTE